MGAQVKKGNINVLSPEQKLLLRYLAGGLMNSMGQINFGEMWGGPGSTNPILNIPGPSTPLSTGKPMTNWTVVQQGLRDIVTKSGKGGGNPGNPK